MINILHVSDKLSVGNAGIHGVTRLFSWWIPRFDKSRYKVSVCSLRNYDRTAQYLEELGIRVHCLNKNKFDPSTLMSLLRLIRSERIDILHLHGYGAWTFGRLASLIVGVPAVLHEHFVDPHMPFYQKMVDYLFGRMKFPVFANAEAVRNFCVKKRGIVSTNAHVLYNGIPLDEFNPQSSQDSSTLRKNLGIPKNGRVVGTVGRLDVQKGLEYFLKAIPEICLERPDSYFLVVGDGPLFEQLQGLSRRLGIEDHVHFTGFRKDIPVVLSLIDIMVIPSLWEGTTLTVFEAMAMGKPIVSTNVDGLKEVLRHNETALLVPSRNPSTLAKNILCFLKNQELADRIGNAAKNAVKRYDIQETVRQLEKIYESLLRS